ncbi:glycosyltransferase [Shewanella baltica]|uniref:glycosyltransferase n=1 Tax=Shewanella baltica TaxID=62322 RepID=UPI003984BF75
MSELIYYVGPFSFPNGGAAARRIYGNIKSLREIGYEVKVIDGQAIIDKSEYDDIEVISVGERPSQHVSLYQKIFQYLNIGNKTIEFIKNGEKKPRFIILYSGYSPYLIRLLPFCKDNNIKLIFDCVEWYQPKSFLEYLYKPYYWNVEFAMRSLIPMCDGVICISKFLNQFYTEKGCKTIIIPPTLDFDALPLKYLSQGDEKCSRIKLVYTGNPGHKDLLDEIVNVVKSFDSKLELNIAGIDGINSNNIKYHGYLEHDQAIRLVSDSHFSILLRPLNKTSMAGFSTKVVESMACATPVISNNTGDLSNYILDGQNGYIFDGSTSALLVETLNQVCEDYDLSKYKEISMSAYITASKSFNYQSDSTVHLFTDFFSKMD